jgi:NAD(P)-dependent dehydrogenase (short-subunit alcohol dehydrogenase family)
MISGLMSLPATSMLLDFSERRVLITGAAAGMGEATALRFADAGALLVLLDSNRTPLEALCSKINAAGGHATPYVVDLGRKAQIDAFWDQLAEDSRTAQLPLPDVLVNNAGIFPMYDFLELEPGQLAEVQRINLESVLWMSQAFIRLRQKQGGVIVNVSSIEALLPFKDQMIAYTVGKAGVLALTRGLAREFGRKGFRVNVMLPGGIHTPGTRSVIRSALRGVRFDLMRTGWDFQGRLALGRWGQPDEVARVALFLASDLASYVQGALIPVDGGFLSS